MRKMKHMFRIDIQSSKGIATLACSGSLIYGVETEMLRTMLMSRPEETLRIDLSKVHRVDASGLGLLVEFQAWARKKRRNLDLLDPSEQVWRMVILTKLYLPLQIRYSDVATISQEYGLDDCREMIA